MYRIVLLQQSFGMFLTCGLVRDSVMVLVNQSFYNKMSSLWSVTSNKYWHVFTLIVFRQKRPILKAVLLQEIVFCFRELCVTGP